MRGYIASYTRHSVDGRGNGEGITAIAFDPATGRIAAGKVYPGASPSWLTIAPDGRHAYTVNEIADFAGTHQGSVTAYAIEGDGALLPLNAVASGGALPAHCTVHPGGHYVLVANYAGGHLAVLPIHPDGSLAEATDVKAPSGTAGPTVAAHAPPGSFAWSGHDASHAHMIAADPSQRFVLSNDLGADLTHVWTLDATGVLKPHDPPLIVAASAGAGPRHFAFHPNGRVFYNLYEEASELAVYAWDAPKGTASLLQCAPTLPEGYAGSSFASAIAIQADRRFLYTANRLHNSIAIFAMRDDGRVRLVDNEWTRGDYPNHIALDPTGSFLIACNRRSDQVTTFRVDRTTGALRFTGQYFALGSPNMTVFAA
ncbi:MAG: lactonase family protein [Acetobacteraceae bacterium]